MLETEANSRKRDTDFRCNMMEEEEVGHWGEGRGSHRWVGV